MIRVIYDVKGYTITLEGHAHYGEYGHDLVCAAVSALAHTLKANLQEMAAAGALEKMTAQLVEGQGRFVFVPKRGFSTLVRHRVAALCLGFAVLAERAGDFVCYRVVE